MTPRVLFNIIFKILGLFFLKDCLVLMPAIFSSANDFYTNNNNAGFFIGYLSAFFLYGYFVYFFVFQSNWIIDKLKIEKDFGKEAIPLNIHRSTVLSIAVIVIGGYLLVDEIPNFCGRIVVLLWVKGMEDTTTDTVSLINSLFSVIKIIIGILLITEQRKIVNLIERKRKNE